MKTEVKVALIAGIFAVVVALINYFAPSKVNPGQDFVKPARVIQMTGTNPIYIERDQNNNGGTRGGK